MMDLQPWHQENIAKPTVFTPPTTFPPANVAVALTADFIPSSLAFLPNFSPYL